ncbi:hypothetical protein 162310570 [Organic Lake phycodnavirus]|nr:hypothetical protein 162310570 [Organic Lake phycodnavirus]
MVCYLTCIKIELTIYMSASAFIVEVPTLFTQSTQMASRVGNTTLTGNERIHGNFVVNGSLTLDGTVNDSNVFFESQDISNLIVHNETTLNTLRTFSSIEIDGSGQFKSVISVAGLSSLSDVSCDSLTVDGDLVVVDTTSLNTLQVDGMCVLSDVSCERLDVVDVSCSYLDLSDGLHVIGLSDLADITSNGLSVLPDISCDHLDVVDVSCGYLDLSDGLRVVGLSEMNQVNINEHAHIKDVSCDYLDVKNGARLTGPISYEYGGDYVASLSPLEWFVAGESTSRIDPFTVITLNNIRQGSIFGKTYWMSTKTNGYIQIERDISDSTWCLALAFGVTHYRDGGGLFQQNDTSHNVVLTGDQLVVNDDASGLSIPSFSVLTINHFDAYYEVYLNGILEYSSAVVSVSTTTTGTMFFLKNLVGVQLLAGALWDTTLVDSQIEELTLEALTRLL